MSQPPIYRSKPDRQPKLAVNRAPRATDEYLVDDSSSGDERPRAKPGYHVNDPTTSSAKRSGTKTVDHDDKVTVSGDYLKEMETMIRDLQRRVDACEHGSEPSSDSRMSSRRGSINSVPECDEEYIRDRRDPRSASDWKPRKGGSEAFVIPDGRYMPSPPAPPPFPPPAPLYPYVGVGSSPPLLPLGLPPVSQGCGPITVDGLPRLEIVRWKQCTTKYGEPEWHEDHKSPTATAAPKDFSQKSLLTVIRDYDGNKQFWRRRVHIVSPPVISLLKDLPCYDVHETSQDGEKDGELRLTEPMMVLFHNRKHLQEKATTETRRVRDQLQFVLDFMRNEFSDVTRKLDDIESERPSGLVSYPELFLLYAPGTVVYSLENGEHDAFVVDSIRGMRKRQGGSYGRLDLTCWSINYDGEVFGRVWSVHKIPPFQGVKQINSLDLVPEGFLPKADGVKSDLISRGQKFWSLQGQRFLEYTGEIWSQHASEEAVRVMVDCLTYQRRNDWPISINKKRGPDNAQSKNWQDNKFDSRDSWAFRSGRRRGRAHRSHSPRVIPYDDEYSPERDNGRKRHYSPYSRDRADRPAREYESEFDKYDSLESNSTPDELTLLLCPQHVQGYCLRDKVWSQYLHPFS